MDFTGTLINEFNSLPVLWWLWLIIVAFVAGLVNTLVVGRKTTKSHIIFHSLLATYVVFILMETIIGRKPDIVGYEIVPFWSYSHPELWIEIVLNYILFIPFGFLLYMCMEDRKGWRIALIGFLFSASIEIIQLVFRLGLFEFDDMIGNTIGCMIGSVICTKIKKIKDRG